MGCCYLWWLESKLSDRLWLSFTLALAKPNNIWKQTGAELCQAQAQLGELTY